MKWNGLDRRLAKAETRMRALSLDNEELDLQALEILTDGELEVLLEASTLAECGHSEEEVAGMMQERWTIVAEAMEKAQAEKTRLIEAHRKVKSAT